MSELLSSASPKNKDQLIEDIIQLGSRTGQFSALRGKDTDVFIERKIVNAEYYEADGHGEELIEKMYRAYVLLDESSNEAKYNEEITQLSQDEALDPSTGEASFGISKSLFRGKTFVHKEFGKTWAIKKENLTPGKVIDYSFDVKSIRNPIEEILSQNGWKLSLVTLRKDATYKKKGWFRFR
ncbi:MAG TPA: hypothetical protein VIR31_00235 [Nitrososphaeraceae archaeon]